MTETLTEILALGQASLAVAVFVFLRIGAAMALLPAFGEQNVPQRVRLVLALAFTAIVAPAVAPDVNALLARGGGILLPALGEVAAGLALGIALRLMVLALQIAGTIAAQSTSLSQIFGGGTIEPQPAIGHVMVISGLALAAMLGLHLRVAEALIGSYSVLLPGVLPRPSDIADWGLGRVAEAFALGFSLAAPFVIASFIYNLALGAINRAMPQLMVAFVGAPAITAGGLVLLLLSLPVGLSVWSDSLHALLADPFGARP